MTSALGSSTPAPAKLPSGEGGFAALRRFDDDQDALIQLAKQSERAGGPYDYAVVDGLPRIGTVFTP